MPEAAGGSKQSAFQKRLMPVVYLSEKKLIKQRNKMPIKKKNKKPIKHGGDFKQKIQQIQRNARFFNDQIVDLFYW